MSEEQFRAFLETVKADTSLQDKLKAAADLNAVAAIANEAGFSISADDLAKAQIEVSDEELENAAGGVITRMNWGCLLRPEITEATPWYAKPILP